MVNYYIYTSMSFLIFLLCLLLLLPFSKHTSFFFMIFLFLHGPFIYCFFSAHFRH